MTAPRLESANGQGFEAEPTPIGNQTLVPGVKPITQRDRLDMLAAAPMLAKKAQRPADSGLFDMGARNQLGLFTGKPLL